MMDLGLTGIVSVTTTGVASEVWQNDPPTGKERQEVAVLGL